MGEIWLCEGKEAERPLFLEEEGMRLYSFEELCCYLYENAGVVEESFFNESLCQWLETDVGMRELSGSIRDGIAKEKSGSWCMGEILSAGGYHTREEVGEAARVAERMVHQGPLERAKLRGDRLLREGNCRAAVLEYRRVMEQADGEEGQEEIQSRLWHNMGTAYAKQMLFGRAAECYRNAYEAGRKEESKVDYLLALAFQEGRQPKDGTDVLERFQMLAEKKKSGDRAGYEKAIEDILWELRAEYRKSDSDGII